MSSALFWQMLPFTCQQSATVVSLLLPDEGLFGMSLFLELLYLSHSFLMCTIDSHEVKF